MSPRSSTNKQARNERIMTAPLQIYKFFAKSKWDFYFILLLVAFECVLSATIVKYVPYTEIDWKAYMQEVTMWQNGENDYSKIYGDTGPLVYPAGFLYVFAFLKWLTDGGENLVLGQYIFCGIYVFHAAIVLAIYNLVMREQTASMEKRESNDSHLYSHKVWMWRMTMVLTCMSKRIHSIFVLRLFNDGPCMTLFYISVLLFAKSYWKIGCAFFSLAVSVKMNILLFAPGLLLLLLQSSENVTEVVLCLGICATIQLILGAPFLISHPISYLRKAFEFDRVFFYKWTVNWKFLPEHVFVNKSLSLLLLSLHLLCLALFARKWIQSCRSQRIKCILIAGSNLSPTYVVQTLFLSNFIGIAFARTLHYQFYSWYFHSIPFMLHLTKVPFVLRILLLFMMEYAFNIFPATPWSSSILQLAHFVTLFVLWCSSVPKVVVSRAIIKED